MTTGIGFRGWIEAADAAAVAGVRAPAVIVLGSVAAPGLLDGTSAQVVSEHVTMTT